MASTAVVTLWSTVKDNVGRVAKTCIKIALANWNPAGTVAAAWKVILENLINAASVVEQQTTVSSTAVSVAAIPSPRCNREDKATIMMLDDNGQGHLFKIPTPLMSLGVTLGSDKIDQSNALVIAWASAMASHGQTAAGVEYSGLFEAGRYIKHKREKKGGF